MNYFKLLEISESVSDKASIAEAYSKAQAKWQTTLNQGIGKQQALAREILDDGLLEEAYRTLTNPTLRQQHLRAIKLAADHGVNSGSGRIPVRFSLGNGHVERAFMIEHNPVRHPLALSSSLSVASIQEYICRAWEVQDVGLTHIQDRTLERWLYYSAGAEALVESINYKQWHPRPVSAASLLFGTLDELQATYPVPFLPQTAVRPRKQNHLEPQWEVVPSVVNFGLIPDSVLAITGRVAVWRSALGDVSITSSHPLVTVDTTQLAVNGRFVVQINGSALRRGFQLSEKITVTSTTLGKREIPVFGARAKRIFGNSKLDLTLNQAAGDAALALDDYHTAARYLQMTDAVDARKRAEAAVILQAYESGEWNRVIVKSRAYQRRYGRANQEILLALIEALRVVGATLYQLGEKRRSLKHLAALAYETPYLKDKSALQSGWTAQDEANVQLSAENPRQDWINVAEHFGLNWTHEGGRSDQSKYAGSVPLELTDRVPVWRTGRNVALKPPLIAYEGVLVGRQKNNQAIVALDAASGAVLWRHTQGLTGAEVAEPVAGAGSVFVADTVGTVYSLDIVSGAINWQIKLQDSKDLSCAFADGILFVGSGTQVIFISAENGQAVGETDKMTTFFNMMQSNPVNLLVSNHSCFFQKVGGASPSMVFLNSATGGYIEFPMPVHLGTTRSLFNSFVKGKRAQITWTAFNEKIFLPYIVSLEINCTQRYQDRDGYMRTQTETRAWQELHLFAYSSDQTELLGNFMQVIQGSAYEANQNCSVSVTNYQTATSCAVAPVYADMQGDQPIIYAYRPDKPQHWLIAAGFGSEIYYWLMTHSELKLIGHRRVDSEVQSVAFLREYDLVTTRNSLSTSFVGNTELGNSTMYNLPDSVRPISGTPALYGDVIFVLTAAGEVVAIGR